MNTLDIKTTSRGFPVATFVDRYGAKCSIQDSSLADESALWFGCDEGTHIDGKCVARMHLTTEMVTVLIPVLQRFVDTGSIAP